MGNFNWLIKSLLQWHVDGMTPFWIRSIFAFLCCFWFCRHRHWVMSSPRLTIWTQSRHFPIERGARLFLLWNFHPLLLPLLNWELVAKSSQQCPDFGKKNDALEVGCACVKHPCLCPKRRVCPPTLAKSRHWSLSSFSESKREITRYFWVLQ